MLDVAINEVITCVAQQDFIAVDDPQKPGYHVEVAGETFKIPDDAVTFTLSCDRAGLPDMLTSVIKCRAELSLDGGATWSTLISFRTSGTPVVNEDTGKPVPQSVQQVLIPSPESEGRLVRTTMTPLVDLATTVTAKVD